MCERALWCNYSQASDHHNSSKSIVFHMHCTYMLIYPPSPTHEPIKWNTLDNLRCPLVLTVSPLSARNIAYCHQRYQTRTKVQETPGRTPRHNANAVTCCAC